MQYRTGKVKATMEANALHKGRPWFDDQGLHIPHSALNKYKASHALTLREWVVLLYLTLPDAPQEIPQVVSGNSATLWRIKKSLRSKGLLPS